MALARDRWDRARGLTFGTLFFGGAVKQVGGVIGIVGQIATSGWYELLALRVLTLNPQIAPKLAAKPAT